MTRSIAREVARSMWIWDAEAHSEVDVCLRCGAKHPKRATDEIKNEATGVVLDTHRRAGRPRRYCSPACRQAGNRLLKARGRDWWKQQPWYPAWLADRKREHDEAERERERKSAEYKRKRDEERKLVESMPPEVRAAYEAERRRNKARGKIGMLQLDLDRLNRKYAEPLNELNMAVRIMRGSVRVEKLLWNAVLADSETEALALFAKARKLGADPSEKALHGRELWDKQAKDLMASLGDLFV